MNDRCVGVVIKDRKILTFWRYRKGREYYVLPGGTLEEGEKHEETLKREMLEETNLDVKIGKKLIEYFNNYEHPRTDHYFLITDFAGEIKLGAPELTHQHRENIYRPEWIDIDKLIEVDLMPNEIKLQLIEILNDPSNLKY
jgi:8-oxo-dGTP pyrophosphatase MutT (NUDIX family)